MTRVGARAPTAAQGPAAADRPASRPADTVQPSPLPLLRGADMVRRCVPDLTRRPLLLVSDFDGTLAEIVMDPWGARVLPAARRALRRLAGTPGVHVALLSGRAAPDLASRVRVGGAIYLGDHGVERGMLPRGARAEELHAQQDPALAPFVADAERLAREVPRLVPDPWLIVERKGPAVAFHFRAAPDVPAARQRVMAAVEALDPGDRFVRCPGRRIVELRPPGAAAKRDALRTLVDELRPAVTYMLGDDAADAEAFAVLRALRDAGRTDGLAIAVHAHPAMPEAVAAAADAALASPEEAARFLAGLARCMEGADRPGAPPLRGAASGQPGLGRARSPTAAPSRPPPRSR